MDKELICIDTSILIDFFRKKKKEKSIFVKLSRNFDFAISVITKFEILVGANKDQIDYWESLLSRLLILPLDNNEIKIAADIHKGLVKKNQIIGIKDILIASCAISKNLELVTLNLKDFERVKSLRLLNLEKI